MPFKFINLTEIYADGRNFALTVNVGNIASMKKSHKGDTLINMVGSDRHFHFVRETIDQIKDMIQR